MSCRRVSALLAEYDAGLMAEGKRAAVQAHLLCCEACREQLRELRALDEAIEGSEIEADEVLVRRLMARVRAEDTLGMPRWIYVLNTVLPIAGATVVVMAVSAGVALGALTLLGRWFAAGAPLPQFELPTTLPPNLIPLAALALVIGTAIWVALCHSSQITETDSGSS